MATTYYLVTADSILRIEAVVEASEEGHSAMIRDMDHKAHLMMAMPVQGRHAAADAAFEAFKVLQAETIARMTDAQRAQYYADKDAEARAIFAKL